MIKINRQIFLISSVLILLVSVACEDENLTPCEKICAKTNETTQHSCQLNYPFREGDYNLCVGQSDENYQACKQACG